MLCKAETAKGKKCKNLAVINNEFCRKHLPAKDLRPSDGNGFERKVANILKILGYKIEVNLLIKGCQIDLYAESSKGVISQKLMVECKDYGSNRVVGVQEIKEFAGALVTARGHGIIHQGLFVTTNGYSAEAKELANASGIELTTYPLLSTRLVDFDSYIDQVINDHEQSSVGTCYVDLSGTDVEDYRENPDIAYFRPIDNYINLSLFEKGYNKLALLGNFGIGKSTFCRKYARDLARKYKDERNGRIPVIISLKDYESKFQIHELVLSVLQNRYGVIISPPCASELPKKSYCLVA